MNHKINNSIEEPLTEDTLLSLKGDYAAFVDKISEDTSDRNLKNAIASNLDQFRNTSFDKYGDRIDNDVFETVIEMSDFIGDSLEDEENSTKGNVYIYFAILVFGIALLSYCGYMLFNVF